MSHVFDLIQSSISGNNIIEASAGTGKTYSIEGLYIRILLLPVLEDNLQPGEPRTVKNILVVTYTEAATAELRVRILEKLRKALKGFQITKTTLTTQSGSLDVNQLKTNLARLEDEFIDDLILSIMPLIETKGEELLDIVINQLKLALSSFDEAAIFTIHGFCKRMLSDYSLEAQSGFNFDFTTNQRHIIDECVNDYWRNQVYQADRQYVDFFLSFFKTPSQVTSYFSTVIDKPYTLLKPSAGSLSKDWFKVLNKQFQTLHKIWKKNKTEIENLIQEHEERFKKKYRDNIPAMPDALERYFSQGAPTAVPGILKNFAQSTIKTETYAKFDPVSHGFFEDFEPFYITMCDIKEILVSDFVPYLIDEFQKRKERMNILCFDDLLINLQKAISRKGGDELKSKIRNRFHVALIDEFQDTDPIQYEIFHQLFFDQIPLFLIGDPKQSIYNFRGADIFAYFKAVRDAETKSHLKINWRSCKDLVKAFNTIFSGVGDYEQFVIKDKIKYIDSAGSPQKPDRSLIIENQEPEPFQFWFLKNGETSVSGDIQRMILDATVGEIVRLLNLGVNNKAKIKSDDRFSPHKPVEPKDIAILVSSHAQADQFQHALHSKSVPSVQRGTRNIFETKEFNEVTLLLKAILEYHNESSLRPVFITEIFNFEGEDLLELFEDEERWEKKVEEFQVLNKIWQEKGPFAMLQSFMEKEKIQERFLAYKDGERKLSNFIQISEILQRAQMENQLDNPGLIQWMEKIKLSPEDYEDNEIRLETDDEALSILTVHSSKGLQFPIVFCPYSWSTGKKTSEVMYHDPKNDDQLTWDLLKNAHHKEIANQEKLAEQIRLAYVAFTRAKCCCYIAWGKINGTSRSCYTHLFHQNFRDSSLSFNNIPIDDYWKDLKDLEKRSNGAIAVTDLPSGTKEIYCPAHIEDQKLVAQVMDKNLWPISSIYSFSSLTDKQTLHQSEPEERDIGEVEPLVSPEPVTPNLNLLDIPGGITTGNLFHDILEQVNFHSAEPPSELVVAKLKQYGFSSEWKPLVLKLIQRIRTLPIKSDYTAEGSFSFAKIPPNHMVKEMSFYFTVNQVTISKAKEIVRAGHLTPSQSALLKSLESIQYQEINGFMKGFIDMVFCYQDRYYILDWKTNKLGANQEDYSMDRLRIKMNEYNYNLQYFIYSIALHKYLKTRIPTYRFDKHFGGVYYFFIRGIQDDSENFGVYYESLAESGDLIEALGSFFQGEKNV